MSIKSYSLVTLPLPGFQWGSCTIFSYQGYYVNQIVFTRHPRAPPSWVLVGFVHDLQLLGCQSNPLNSSPSSFLGFSGVRARSLVIRIIMSIKSSSLVILPLPGFQWGSCTIFSYQGYYVNQIVFTRLTPPSWVLVRFVCQSNRIHSSPSPFLGLVGFVHDFQLLGLLCQSNRLHSSPSPFLGFSGVRARSLVIRMSIKSSSLVTSPFLGFSGVRGRSLVIRVIMSIKSDSLVTLPLPGFQWGSCTIFSYQDVNQIVFTRHLPLPGFQWSSWTIFSYQGYYVNQIVFTRHPPPSWVLVGFVHDLQLLGCQSNPLNSSPSPFLGFSEVRARSLVIRVIMSIKSSSLVTLPLPGFQWGSCTIFRHQDVNQIVFTRHPPPSWVLVRFVHDLQLLGLLCQSNRIHSSPSPFLGFSEVRMSIKSYSLDTLPLPGFQ